MVPLEISVWEFLCPIATQALVILFWWGIQGADITWYTVIMYTSLQYPLHYLPDHRLLCVLWGKQKAPGMNLHNRLASINWRFNYFSKFNPGAEALRIDISVLTHYRYVTNQIFSFAFPVATTSMDNHPQAVLSGIRWIQVGRLHDQYCLIYS